MTKPVPPRLDPADEIRPLGPAGIDRVIAPIMASRTQSPIVRQSKYSEIDARLPRDLPATGIDLDTVVTELDDIMTRYARRNTHPGFYGYVASPGLPTDPLAQAMVAAYNQNVVGYPGAPGAATIERCVIRWLAGLTGFGEQADGVLMGGGSLANLTAVAAALVHHFGPDYRDKGLAACSKGETPVILCAKSVHFSIQRAAGVLGLGTANVIAVDTDDAFRMDLDALERAFERHSQVVCVIGSAGTTLTGSIDPLADIARACRKRDTWFHVDAAYGGGALLSPELATSYAGIEQADSVTMDLHKWFYLGFDGSVLLYRQPQVARQLFYTRSDYVQFPPDGPPEQHMFFHLSPELSRRFRALPAYLLFRHYGAGRLGRNVWHNVQCTRYLADLLQADPEFELLHRPELSICCFRYAPPGIPAERVDEINRGIRDRLEQEGDFYLSPTSLEGRPVLRICLINHATRAAHMAALVDRCKTLGRSLKGNEPTGGSA